MSFFNDDFYKNLDKNYGVEEDKEKAQDTFDKPYYDDNVEIEFNKQNQNNFKYSIDKTSFKNDVYWELNNPVIKIILISLLIVIVVGLLYYIVGWLNLV